MGDVKINLIVSIYGNTEIEKILCPNCNDYAFLIDGESACCDEAFELSDDVVIDAVIAPEPKRTKISEAERQQILKEQNNKCIYCDVRFGDYYLRNSKTYFAYPNWDHLVPFAYSRNNNANNFVAACRACNQIKSSKMFDTIDDARNWIRKQRIKKGFKIIV